MIIQSTPHINQAAPPEIRAQGAAPAIAEPKPAVTPLEPITLPQPSSAELKAAVDAINTAVQQSNRNLEFSVDSDTNRTVVRMVDTSTGELIRQFPSESVLEIARGIEQFQQGLLLTQKV